MREPLGCVGREVEDLRELVRTEQLVDELGIGDRAVDEGRSGRDVRLEAAAEIVEDDDLVATVDQVPGDVCPDEAGSAGDENRHRAAEASNRPVSTRREAGRAGSPST